MKLHGAFVGINSYEDKMIRPLRFASADAESFYNRLSQALPKNETHLSLLTDKDATRQNILELIGERLPRIAVADDLVLIFFAGHGAPETDDSVDSVSRYIVAHDTKYNSIFATGIDLEADLTRLIKRIQAKLIVVFMDTCFSGQAGGRTFEGPRIAQHRANLRAGLELSKLDLGEGRVILSASDSNELAREDPTLQHGVFTFFVLQTLENHGSDWISLNSLYETVFQQVHDFTKGRQNPIMNGRVKMAKLPVLSVRVRGKEMG